jgi:hypothetical protein
MHGLRQQLLQAIKLVTFKLIMALLLHVIAHFPSFFARFTLLDTSSL